MKHHYSSYYQANNQVTFNVNYLWMMVDKLNILILQTE
jgi:hypothetical protein